MATASATVSSGSGPRPLITRLNAEWHERASYVFLGIVLAHWAEHLAQTF